MITLITPPSQLLLFPFSQPIRELQSAGCLLFAVTSVIYGLSGICSTLPVGDEEKRGSGRHLYVYYDYNASSIGTNCVYH